MPHAAERRSGRSGAGARRRTGGGFVFGGGAGRQVDGKGAALARGARDGERAPVAVDHVLDDGEAEPGAAELARARGVDPVEPLGQARLVLEGNPLAVTP